MQGYVSCSCYRNKLAKPHPHPASLLHHATGTVLIDPKASEKVREDHEEWLYDACSHSFMQVAWEDLGEPHEKQLLLTALKGGGERVALIAAISRAEQPLPPWTPDQVQQAADQLAWLRKELPPVPVHEVRDAVSNELLVDTVGEEVYVTTGEGTQLGVNARGIWMSKRGAEVFSTHTLLQDEQPDGTYKLTPEGGSALVSSAAFIPYDSENPDRHRPTPRRVVHTTVQRGPATLERHLEPIDKLLKAALKLKHAIVWIA